MTLFDDYFDSAPRKKFEEVDQLISRALKKNSGTIGKKLLSKFREFNERTDIISLAIIGIYVFYFLGVFIIVIS